MHKFEWFLVGLLVGGVLGIVIQGILTGTFLAK